MKLFTITGILSSIIVATTFFAVSPALSAPIQKNIQSVPMQEELAKLEASSGGRIGMYAINTANNTHLQYRADERFPMGCTAKVMGVATVLHQSMSNNALLSEKIYYTKKDLTNWTPITEKHIASGMTVAELSAAAISYSDNTAMRLLVKKMGGLEQMNKFARSIDDKTFRQDHDWPEEALSGGLGNVNDSTTPKAMAESLQKLAFTNVLAKPQQQLLISWLKANVTGDTRIRAGVPKNWVVGDKTGTGAVYGTTNDIGIIWPTKCAPIVLAIYYTTNDKQAKKKDDIVASVTRIVVDEFAKNDRCISKASS
jgi:beta-lactamase class A